MSEMGVNLLCTEVLLRSTERSNRNTFHTELNHLSSVSFYVDFETLFVRLYKIKL